MHVKGIDLAADDERYLSPANGKRSVIEKGNKFVDVRSTWPAPEKLPRHRARAGLCDKHWPASALGSSPFNKNRNT
jgi:hypothetical protein